MAKKTPRGVKSQAIRDYLNANKKAKASEVVAALAEKGIKVSAPMVYNLKARKNMRKRVRRAKLGNEIGNGMVAITNLLAAKKLVDQAGGMAEARAALDALAKLA